VFAPPNARVFGLEFGGVARFNDRVEKARPNVRVLGIDPGSQVTGFGLVRVADDGSMEHVSHGIIAPPSTLDFYERLSILSEEIEALIEKVRPDIVVVERIFLGKNADSAFKLGHVRGVAVAAALRAGCGFVEYAARAVKKGVTGNGSASKEQVQIILFAALGLRGSPAKLDASDALALAFYHGRRLEVSEARSSSGRLRREVGL
jgi:crossover junction endodeoxyribonuclease RuvC